MTTAEVSQLLLAMAAAWPSLQVDELRVRMWAEMVADIDHKTALLALRVLMCRNTFPPSIAEFRGVCLEIRTPDAMGEGTAWQMVGQAVGDVLRAQQRSYAALHDLPPRIREVCQEIGYAEVVAGDPDVVRNNFFRIWQGKRRRERDLAVLPTAVRDAITQAQLSAGAQQTGLPETQTGRDQPWRASQNTR